MYTGCYACGQDGHRRSECPSREPLPAPAPGLTAAPEPTYTPPPPPASRPASYRAQYADTSPWAEQIRAQMGWTSTVRETRELDSRAKAAEQVAEARAARIVLP